MPLERLKPLEWFDANESNFIADFQRRVVKIDGIPCKLVTIGNLIPGAFGVRMRINRVGKILAVNHLPYDKCVCDADLPTLPEENTNPCWINLHLHGSWTSAKEDDVYACIKPGQQKQYCYTISKCHPTSLFIIHPHNFSSSVPLDQLGTFPVQIYNPKKPDYPDCFPSETLYITFAYMQQCSREEQDKDGCELESFDFVKYQNRNDFAERLHAAPKLILTNGQNSPYKQIFTNVPFILRIAFTGIGDFCRLVLLDDQDRRIPFRVLSIDSMPISSQCNELQVNPKHKNDKNNGKHEKGHENVMIVREFLMAHMQRVDIMILLTKPTQYRLLKLTTPEELKNLTFAVPTHVLLYLNGKSQHEDCDNGGCTLGSSGPVVRIPPVWSTKGLDKYRKMVKVIKEILANVLHLKKNCWMRRVNSTLRSLPQVAAWRTMRFEFPEFPDIEGAQFTKEAIKVPQVVLAANRPEVWLVGAHSGTHSLHVHLLWFLIMAERQTTAAEPDPMWRVIPRHKQWFQDTLLLMPGQQYLIWVFPFADPTLPRELRATGKAFVHCHQNFHSDAMMMLSMLISPSSKTRPSGVGLQRGPQSEVVREIVKFSGCSHS